MSLSSSLKITINRERSKSWDEEIVGYEDSKKLVGKNQKEKDVEEISLSSCSDSERKRSTSKEKKNEGTPSLTPSPEWKRRKRRYSPEPTYGKRRRSKSKTPEKKPKRLPFLEEISKKLNEKEALKKQYGLQPIRETPLGSGPDVKKIALNYQQRLQENMRLQKLREQQVKQQQKEEPRQRQVIQLSPPQQQKEAFLGQAVNYQQVPPQPYAQEQYQSIPQQQPESSYQPIPQQQLEPSYQPLPQQQQEPLLPHPLHQSQPQPQPQHVFHQQPPPQHQYAHWPPQPHVNPLPYQQLPPQQMPPQAAPYEGHLYPGMEIPHHLPPVQAFPSMTYTYPNPNFPYGVPPSGSFAPPPQVPLLPQPQPQPQPRLQTPPSQPASSQPLPSQPAPSQPPPSQPPPSTRPPSQPPPSTRPPSQPSPPQRPPSQTPQKQPSPPPEKQYEEIIISPGSPEIEVLIPPLMTFKPPSSPDKEDDTTVPFSESPKRAFEAPAEELPTSSETPPSSINFEDFNPEPEFETELFLTSEQMKNIPIMELSAKDTEEIECHKKLIEIINDSSISEKSNTEALEQYKKEIQKKAAEKKKLDEIKMTLGVNKSRSGVKTSTPCRPAKKSTNLDNNSGGEQPSGSKSSLEVPEDTPSEASEAILQNALVKRIQDAIKNLEKDRSTAPVPGRFILYPLENPHSSTLSPTKDLPHQSPLLKGRGKIRITDPDHEPEDASSFEGEKSPFSFYCDDEADSPEPADLSELISTVIKKVNNNGSTKPASGERKPFTLESAVQCDFTTKAINKLVAEVDEQKRELGKISNQNANLKNMTDHFRNLKKCYQEKKDEIEQLKKIGAEKDEEIKSLKEELLKGDKSAGRTAIATAEITGLCHRLKQKDREINALKKAVGELSNENDKLKKEAKNKTAGSVLKNDTIMVHRQTQTAVTDVHPVGTRKSAATQASVDKRARNTQTDESSFTTSRDSPTGESTAAASSTDKIKAKNEEARQKYAVNSTKGQNRPKKR